MILGTGDYSMYMILFREFLPPWLDCAVIIHHGVGAFFVPCGAIHGIRVSIAFVPVNPRPRGQTRFPSCSYTGMSG